jgi:hypothetical protein
MRAWESPAYTSQPGLPPSVALEVGGVDRHAVTSMLLFRRHLAKLGSHAFKNAAKSSQRCEVITPGLLSRLLPYSLLLLSQVFTATDCSESSRHRMGSTATGNGLYNTLESLAIEAKTWECKLLFNEAVDRDAPPEIVDLCDFLSPITKRNRTSNFDYPNRTNYMFPERFKGLASKTQLEMELRLAAIKGGFTLDLRTSQTADAIVKNCPKGEGRI